VDDDSSATGNSAAFLSITFERLAVSPPSSELGTSRRRRSGRSASGAAAATAEAAAGRSESLLLGRNGRRRSAASLIRRSKLTDILRSRESPGDGSAVGSAGAADIVPAGAVKDGSDDSKDFGREFSAAFESFASLSLDSKGGCKIGGGEGKVEQKFSSASYRTPSVSMAGLPHLHRNLVLQFNLKWSSHIVSKTPVRYRTASFFLVYRNRWLGLGTQPAITRTLYKYIRFGSNFLSF
jgi:hypothetical protein